MKKNVIQLFSVAIVLSMAFFVSCSDSDDLQKVIEPEKKISLSITSSPATRGANGSSAIGVVPIVNDLTIYFLSNSMVVHYERVDADESGSVPGEMTFNIPQSSDKVIVFGNQSGALDSDMIFAKGTSVSDLMKFPISLDKHHNLSPNSVFVYGDSFVTAVADGSCSANIVLLPSLSRIEIGGVESSLSSRYFVSSYTLSGIYIGNTYESLGLDQKTVVDEPSNVINYRGSSEVWTDGGSYPAPFHDIITDVTRSGMKVSPAAPADLWSYYVHPLKDNAPTFDGMHYNLVPNIILRLCDVRVEGRSDIIKESFLTVSRFVNSSTREDIKSFERGKVYSISSISFGGEHLSLRAGYSPDIITPSPSDDPNNPSIPPAPPVPSGPEVFVTVVVSDWLLNSIETELI